MFKSWKIAVGIMLSVSSMAQADDAVKLGRFQPNPDGFGAMVKTAKASEDKEPFVEGDTELAFHGRRRFAYGFSAGYAAGAWGGWSGGWGGYYRPAVHYYNPYVYGYSYYPRVVTYSNYYHGGFVGGYGYGYANSGWCGISGTSAPTISLSTRQPVFAQPASRTAESEPVPQVAPSTIPPATDEANTIKVSLPGSKPSYKYPAYGDKK
jgi:hypothetical protein